MTAEPSRPRAIQAGLFLPPSPDPDKLELTMARLASLVGDSNIGSPQLTDTHRPSDFRMDRFAPSHEESKTYHYKNESLLTSANQLDCGKAIIGFRMFRPPLPANVQMEEGRPQRVSFLGAQGKVVAASGPWRSSGDWWREDSWHQDEWDFEIYFPISSGGLKQNTDFNPKQGLYRFYYDSIRQCWFVRGIYD
jgi:protein ImuB